jgi:1-acyl-sn-glycerol-3-phosphate acyltransferase
VVDEALRLMRGGANLHLFPEGTRTRDGLLREKVYLRLVEACFDAGFDVVPACVWGTDRAIPAEGILVWPGQSVGIEVEAPLERWRFASGEEYARASWARVVGMANRRGANENFQS